MSDREELIALTKWTIKTLEEEITEHDVLTENAEYVIACVVAEARRTLERIGKTYPREEQRNGNHLNHQG